MIAWRGLETPWKTFGTNNGRRIFLKSEIGRRASGMAKMQTTGLIPDKGGYRVMAGAATALSAWLWRFAEEVPRLGESRSDGGCGGDLQEVPRHRRPWKSTSFPE